MPHRSLRLLSFARACTAGTPPRFRFGDEGEGDGLVGGRELGGGKDGCKGSGWLPLESFSCTCVLLRER